MSERESVDHIWAGVLNGTIIAAIGTAFPAFFLWQLIARGMEAISDMRGMSLIEFSQGCWALIFSFLFLRSGYRLLAENTRALRNR